MSFDFAFSQQPVVKVMARFAAAALVNLVSPAADVLRHAFGWGAGIRTITDRFSHEIRKM